MFRLSESALHLVSSSLCCDELEEDIAVVYAFERIVSLGGSAPVLWHQQVSNTAYSSIIRSAVLVSRCHGGVEPDKTTAELEGWLGIMSRQ